jgi:hypothetical protein
MSLRHPTNPALWADGTNRSQGNAFDDASRAYGINEGKWLRHQQFDADARLRSTRAVDKARAKGQDLSVKALADWNTIKPIHSPKPLKNPLLARPHGEAYSKV